MQDLANAIDLASGVQKAVNAAGAATLSNSSGTNAAIASGVLTLHTGTGADLSITGRADLLKALGLTASVGSGDVTVTKQRTITTASLGTLVQDGSTLNVNGKTITFKNAAVPAGCQRRRPAPASAATSSPTATATRRSTCRAARSPTR